MRILPCSVIAIVLLSCNSSSQNTGDSNSGDRPVGGRCEDCDLIYEGMPGEISWQTVLAPETEPGAPLTIRGVIYQHDGITPAEGVILYVYHTDIGGNYSPAPGQTDGKRHGHLRGWMKTNATGQYMFTTIRPASYPGSSNPQHIHPIIKEPGLKEYWIDDFLFSDDPFLTPEQMQHHRGVGGSGVITLNKNDHGSWYGERDIILGLNVSGYEE